LPNMLLGYGVVAATNGVEVQTIASEERFDIVIIDFIMPDLKRSGSYINNVTARGIQLRS